MTDLKAKAAMIEAKIMIEAIKLQTACLKDDILGIARHSKKLAQLYGRRSALTSKPAPSPKQTITIDINGENGWINEIERDAKTPITSLIENGFFERHGIKAERV